MELFIGEIDHCWAVVVVGADVNGKDDAGRTALFMAAENGREAIVQALVEPGADFNGEDDAGRVVLFMAAENGHKAVVKLLLAPDGIELDSKDKWDRAPLSWAERNEREAGTTSQPRLERTSARQQRGGHHRALPR